MQQTRRFLKVDTTQQRQVVHCLKQSKMIFHPCGGCTFRGETILQLLLELHLASEESIEQRELLRLNCAAISTRREQVVSVHGYQQRGVGIRFGHHADSALTHRQIVSKVYFFKRRILPHELNGKRTW